MDNSSKDQLKKDKYLNIYILNISRNFLFSPKVVVRIWAEVGLTFELVVELVVLEGAKLVVELTVVPIVESFVGLVVESIFGTIVESIVEPIVVLVVALSVESIAESIVEPIVVLIVVLGVAIVAALVVESIVVPMFKSIVESIVVLTVELAIEGDELVVEPVVLVVGTEVDIELIDLDVFEAFVGRIFFIANVGIGLKVDDNFSIYWYA